MSPYTPNIQSAVHLKATLIQSFTKVQSHTSLDIQDIENMHKHIGILYNHHGDILNIDRDCLVLKKIKLFLVNDTGKNFLKAHEINIPNNIDQLINSEHLTQEQNNEFNRFVSAILSISSPEQIVENYTTFPETTVFESLSGNSSSIRKEDLEQHTTSLLPQWLEEPITDLEQKKSKLVDPQWLEEMRTDLNKKKSKSPLPQWFVESSEATRTKEKSAEKYEQIPTPDIANWILVSMGQIGRIQEYLSHFPQSNGSEDHVGSIACSSTLIWSGTEGNNVPTNLYRNLPLGFTFLDPSKIVVPYAEFFASGTSSIVPDEYLKTNSKYNDKMGRTLTQGMQPIVNHAKWQHSTSQDGLTNGTYHKEGDPKIFAANVWRKFHKRGKKALNEALALQAGPENPINGIIIRADIFNKIDDHQKLQLINILQDYPHLKIFIYDTRLKEHIVREMDNKKAIAFLESKIGVTTLETTESESFTPFMGNNSREREVTTGSSAVNFLSYAKAAVDARRTIRTTEQHYGNTSHPRTHI